MARRDYVRLARALRETRPREVEALYQWATTAYAIMRELAEDNSRFNMRRFARAAGLED